MSWTRNSRQRNKIEGGKSGSNTEIGTTGKILKFDKLLKKETSAQSQTIEMGIENKKIPLSEQNQC